MVGGESEKDYGPPAYSNKIANCGVLPKSLAVGGMPGIEWIIGSDLLRQGAIGLDLRHNRHRDPETG
jgi:hypothetical protein